MTLAIVYTRALAGMQAPLVTVEVHMARGGPHLNIVGLPATAVKESRYRVQSAILNAQFEFPRRRLIVNLAPADLPKEGGRFDLAIAIGILVASGQLPNRNLSEYEWIGELALSGELRAVRGTLPAVLAAQTDGRLIIVPDKNANEASLVKQSHVYVADHLLSVCAFLRGEKTLSTCAQPVRLQSTSPVLDLIDVYGQAHAKRALEIAAAGKHSLLMVGPPGTGKTMLANRIIGLLPDLTDQQALEAATIASLSHAGFNMQHWHQLPFRTPHHSSSSPALVGGGRPPRPGEISLAHHGVLFLDELTEFNRAVLESMREPLESGQVTISRAAYQATFPAQFQLIAAMNPCPCGFAGSLKMACRCSDEQVKRYLAKLSGPLLDRIDMQIEVPDLPPDFFSITIDQREPSALVKKRVWRAREQQMLRQGKCNNELQTNELQEVCFMAEDASNLIKKLMEKFNFSARAYHRTIKVARTIADLAESKSILIEHLSESCTYRTSFGLKFNQDYVK